MRSLGAGTVDDDTLVSFVRPLVQEVHEKSVKRRPEACGFPRLHTPMMMIPCMCRVRGCLYQRLCRRQMAPSKSSIGGHRLAVVAALFVAGMVVPAVKGVCPNGCSGHGTCGDDDVCHCYTNWGSADAMSGDCSQQYCPMEVRWSFS